MKLKTFVVTNPELGWDCVIGVFQAKSKKELIEFLEWDLQKENNSKYPGYSNDCEIFEQKIKIVK